MTKSQAGTVSECVIDTNILQKANARLLKSPVATRKFYKRIALLERIMNDELHPLMSQKLLAEYETQVREPRNDFVKAFLEIITMPDRVSYNWHRPWRGDAEKARKCRFPSHDDHVLRTAIRPHASTIYTEERPMLATDACIYRAFRVHIRDV